MIHLNNVSSSRTSEGLGSVVRTRRGEEERSARGLGPQPSMIQQSPSYARDGSRAARLRARMLALPGMPETERERRHSAGTMSNNPHDAVSIEALPAARGLGPATRPNPGRESRRPR